MNRLIACILCLQCSVPVCVLADDAGLLLARIAVSEAGFNDSDDGEAIALMSMRQARDRGMELVAFLRARYKRALAPASARRNRPWLAGLTRSLDAPPLWPHANQPWTARRGQWRDLLTRMDRVAAGRSKLTCIAHVWGGPEVDAKRIARILANGGRIVSCGRTRNIFLRLR